MPTLVFETQGEKVHKMHLYGTVSIPIDKQITFPKVKGKPSVALLVPCYSREQERLIMQLGLP